MADIKPRLFESDISNGSEKPQAHHNNRRNAIKFVAAAGLLASFGLIKYDGPEKGRSAKKEVVELDLENTKYVKAIDDFISSLNQYDNKQDKTPQDFTNILESYFQLVILFGQTYELGKSFLLNTGDIQKFHKTDFSRRTEQVPKEFKDFLGRVDQQVAIKFNSVILLPENITDYTNFDILDDSHLKDPWEAFNNLDKSFKPAIISLKDYRILLIRMAALLGVMHKKSEIAERLKSEQLGAFQKQSQSAQAKFITYKTDFLKQMSSMIRK